MNSQTTPQNVSSNSLDALLAGAPAPLDAVSRRVLRALFELGLRDSPADAGAVARLLPLRASAVGQCLVRLDSLGLVRADRARLTMAGLATAARLPALESVRAEGYDAQMSGSVAAGATRPLSVRDSLPGLARQRIGPDRPQAHVPPASRLLQRRTIRTSPSPVSL